MEGMFTAVGVGIGRGDYDSGTCDIWSRDCEGVGRGIYGDLGRDSSWMWCWEGVVLISTTHTAVRVHIGRADHESDITGSGDCKRGRGCW